MRITIIGCGRVGSRLAERLSKGGHEISIIDEHRDAFRRLNTSFPGNSFQGSGLDPAFLERTGATRADIVFALTGGDNRNLMIAQLFKHQYGVMRSVARLHDPVRAATYRELGVETLCTTTVLEGLLELYVNHGDFPDLPGEMSVSGDASDLHQ